MIFSVGGIVGNCKEGKLLFLMLISHVRVPPGPLCQNEVKCSAFDMETIFHSHANKTHFHKKACVLGLIWKVRFFEPGSGLL